MNFPLIRRAGSAMLSRMSADATAVTYRWINLWEATEQEIAQIDRIIEQNGWITLNLRTTRVLVAEIDSRIVGFSVCQFMPYVGPLYVDRLQRGAGVADTLADKTLEFLREVEARGWLVVADSPHVEKICQDRDMQKVESPVYVYNSSVKGLVN